MTPIPFFDLREQHAPLQPELEAAFARVLRSGQFILGAEVEQLEAELAAANGTRFALTTSSGTDAISLALMTLGIGPGDEVLCPSFTFFSTAGCIARLGARPVWVESSPTTFNLDVAAAAPLLSPRTRAIIPVHLFGQSADLDPLLAFASAHGLAIVEDAAQAMGATYRGRAVGGFGQAGALSFFPTKNLGALGDAGALLTNDAAFYERARRLRVHGMEPKYHHAEIGGNYRLDALQAALLRVKLPHLPTYTAARRQQAARYTARLLKLPGVALNLPETPDAGPCLLMPVESPTGTSIWNQFTLRVTGPGRRDALRAHLAEHGVGSEVYYPIPLHEQPCFAAFAPPPGSLPVAHRLAEEVLSLPIYPELGEDRLDRVVEVIARFPLGAPSL